MLGNFEKRSFHNGEKVWCGQYQNLTNVLHWHFECELIHIRKGNAHIKIGTYAYDGQEGDLFFCAGEAPHYILSSSDSQIDILIFDRSICMDIADKYTLTAPKLPKGLCIEPYITQIKHALRTKDPLYREAINAYARTMLVDIFRTAEITINTGKTPIYNDLIRKINEEYANITFSDAARYCGYSPSHFSKVFKALSGMHFSNYLNILRIENAITMLQTANPANITAISRACGFTTIRNFNRVFRQLTGYSPRSLPKGFTLDTALHIPGQTNFDPTQRDSILMSTAEDANI